MKVICNHEDKRMGISLLRYQNPCMLTEQAPHGFNHYVKNKTGMNISKVYSEFSSQAVNKSTQKVTSIHVCIPRYM